MNRGNVFGINGKIETECLTVVGAQYAPIGAMSMEEVKREDSKSTNATINYCYRLVHADREKDYSPTIKELYDFQVKGESVLYNGLVYLTFQDEKSTARTLEEAMLNKLLKVDVFHAIKRSVFLG